VQICSKHFIGNQEKHQFFFVYYLIMAVSHSLVRQAVAGTLPFFNLKFCAQLVEGVQCRFV
jgi:hypothetical protein